MTSIFDPTLKVPHVPEKTVGNIFFPPSPGNKATIGIRGKTVSCWPATDETWEPGEQVSVLQVGERHCFLKLAGGYPTRMRDTPDSWGGNLWALMLRVMLENRGIPKFYGYSFGQVVEKVGVAFLRCNCWDGFSRVVPVNYRGATDNTPFEVGDNALLFSRFRGEFVAIGFFDQEPPTSGLLATPKRAWSYGSRDYFTGVLEWVVYIADDFSVQMNYPTYPSTKDGAPINLSGMVGMTSARGVQWAGVYQLLNKTDDTLWTVGGSYQPTGPGGIGNKLLGNGGQLNPAETPVQVLEKATATPLSGIIDFYARGTIALAARNDGVAFGWGGGLPRTYSPTGDIYTQSTAYEIPTSISVGGVISGTLTGIQSVCTNGAACMAVESGTGKVVSWGPYSNAPGDLALSLMARPASPEIPAASGFHYPGIFRYVLKEDEQPLTDIVRVWAGQSAFFAVDVSGLLWVWGWNTQGQCGVGIATPGYIMRARRVVGLGGIGLLPAVKHFAARFVSVGGTAILSTGQVATWGHNPDGQCLTGSLDMVQSPPLFGWSRLKTTYEYPVLARIDDIETGPETAAFAINGEGQLRSFVSPDGLRYRGDYETFGDTYPLSFVESDDLNF